MVKGKYHHLRKIKARTEANEILWIFFGIHVSIANIYIYYLHVIVVLSQSGHFLNVPTYELSGFNRVAAIYPFTLQYEIYVPKNIHLLISILIDG